MSSTSSSAATATASSVPESNFPTAYRIIIVTVIAAGLLVIAVSSFVIRQRRLRVLRDQREDRQRFLMDVRAEYRDLGRRRGPVGWWEFRELEVEGEMRPLLQRHAGGRTGLPAIWDVGLPSLPALEAERDELPEVKCLPDAVDDWQPIELSFAVTLPPPPPAHTSILVPPPIRPPSPEPIIDHLSISFLLQLPHEPDVQPLPPDEMPLPPMELATLAIPLDSAHDPEHKVQEMRNEALIFRRPGSGPSAGARGARPSGLPPEVERYLLAQDGVPSRFITPAVYGHQP